MFRRAWIAASFGAVVAISGATVAAAAPVTVGSSDFGGSCLPFGCNEGAATQDYYQIYSAAALGSRTFDTVSFFDDVDFPGSEVLAGTYQISFATTSAAVGSDYATLASDLQNVGGFFTGALGGPLSGGRLTIHGAAYGYNAGAGNLVMRIQVSGQLPVFNGEQANFAYLDADYTGADVSVAFDGAIDSYGGLVTEFSSGAIPEPGTWALMLAGFGGLGGVLRMRRRQAALAA